MHYLELSWWPFRILCRNNLQQAGYDHTFYGIHHKSECLQKWSCDEEVMLELCEMDFEVGVEGD